MSESSRQAGAILIRTTALATFLVGLFLLLRAMGPGVGTVLIGGLMGVAAWGGTLAWSAADARRSPTVGPLALRWVAVTVLLLALYACAGRLAPGSYGEEMGLAELVGLSAALGGVLVLLPAALGIALGSSLRRR